MHLNYYFLSKLSSALNIHLKGLKLAQLFSQTKDELVFHFISGFDNSDFYLKALLSPSFSCLSFPQTFQRAKRNSIDLFNEIIDQEVLEVIQFKNERAFCIEFANGYSLVFKLFGNRSNIILYKEGMFLNMFHKKMEQDSKLTLPLDREIDNTLENFLSNPDLQTWFPTLRGIPETYLHLNGIGNLSIKKQWELIEETIGILLKSKTFYIIKLNNRYHLSLLSLGEIFMEDHDILNISNEFYRLSVSRDAFEKESNSVLAMLQKEILKSENFISKTTKRIKSIKEDGNYQQLGDIIMANLGKIPPHEASVKLFDFYIDKEIEIKLKPHLNPQKNAETYYRKAKNQFLEIKTLEKTLADRKAKLDKLIEARKKIAQSDSLKSLRQHIKNLDISSRLKKQEETLPYIEKEVGSYKILIGKNAKSNDKLLSHFSRKEDLWLHVKDAPGSHVIIKFQSGTTFSLETIEKAAQLAAYYSKRKSESLVPVTYTPRKYVRKRKGDPPGMVVVEREKVILASPSVNPT